MHFTNIVTSCCWLIFVRYNYYGLEKKLEVCRLVERGESLRKIANSFVMGLFTVSDFYRSRRQLTDFVPQNLQLRYDLDFVYNTDETDLIWKCLPKTSLA
ncbi:hypothetical protein T06_8627 [Trichinella sp. T6]|nr:hypothetical protein T06_8627 [Trichinella sp. T6]